MKFGIFYEHQLPRPWEDGDEYRLFQDALEQVELADRLGFDVVWEVEHHFLEEYSHSSAPEVFLGARQPAHEGHPSRARHHSDRPRLQPPGPHRRAGGHAGSALGRPGGVRLGRVGFGGRARRLPGRPGHQARGLARGPGGRAALHDRDAVQRRRRHVRPDAAAQRRAQADAEAASAAVGGLLAARHDPPGRREGDRRAHLRLHRPRRGGQVGRGLRAHPGRVVRPRRRRRSTRTSPASPR